MDFEIMIARQELNYLEEAANDLMRIEHIRKTDRKIIIKSFKEIKEKLGRISPYPVYMIVGSDKEEPPHPESLGYEGFTWNAGKWNLAFVGPREEDLLREIFFGDKLKGKKIIDFECSWEMR